MERAVHRPGSGGRTWYETQQEHLLGWLFQYDTEGYYGRKYAGRSAEFFYNHFNCAPGLLWLAEAAGAPRPLLLRAKRAVLAAGKQGSAQSAALRRILPWAAVLRLLEEHPTRRLVSLAR